MALDGTYQGTVKSMTGSTPCEMTLKQTGSVLTGSATAMGVSSNIDDGVVDGNTFTGKLEGNGPLGHMVLQVEGSAEGALISGTIKVGRLKATFEATRV